MEYYSTLFIYNTCINNPGILQYICIHNIFTSIQGYADNFYTYLIAIKFRLLNISVAILIDKQKYRQNQNPYKS